MTIRAHTCLGEGCGKRITWSFALCSDCEKKYGHSAYDWPDWLRFLWQDEQRERRRDKKVNTRELTFTDIEESNPLFDTGD